MDKTEAKLEHSREILQYPRWQSVVNRDSHADGTLFYSVKTTGVYCRPSCEARLALPEMCSITERPEMLSGPDFALASAANQIKQV